MIIKGHARGRARQLAAHLLRADQNEIVKTVECRGTIAQDVADALLELETQALAIVCKRPLYHASISPEARRPLEPGQVRIAVDLLEQRLGLTAQPRLVVLHRKKGREHLHVVWSRVDLEHGRAISDSWSYRHHEEAARELELIFGHRPVQGTHARGLRGPRPTKTLKDYELRQAERSGISPAQVEAVLSALWREATNGREFRSKLAEAGYTLARGDRRVFVVVDQAGEVHSLSRRLHESSEKICSCLDDLDLDKLPAVVDVRRTGRRQRKTAVLRSGFVAAARQMTSRPDVRRTIRALGYPVARSAVAARDQPRSAARSTYYRSARAILFASFASRIDEAIRYAPRDQVASIIAALKQERQAALNALHLSHVGGGSHPKSRTKFMRRKRKRSHFSARWRYSTTMKLPYRTTPM